MTFFSRDGAELYTGILYRLMSHRVTADLAPRTALSVTKVSVLHTRFQTRHHNTFQVITKVSQTSSPGVPANRGDILAKALRAVQIVVPFLVPVLWPIISQLSIPRPALANYQFKVIQGTVLTNCAFQFSISTDKLS